MKFTKTIRGGWQFTINGVTFEAIRNIAGFAHRDWEVWTVRDGAQDRCIADQLPTRAECVEMADAATLVSIVTQRAVGT